MARADVQSLGPDGAALRSAVRAYAQSIERDAQPSGLARVYLYERLIRPSLQTRLRLTGALALGLKPRRAPLIVCGLPRSGTTVLHRLLALADDAAALPLWRLLEPFPPEAGPDQRYEHASLNKAWIQRLGSDSLDAQHYVHPDLPDECAHLLRCAFMGSMLWQVPAYSCWSGPAARTPRQPTACGRPLLATLEPEDRRLVLKDPSTRVTCRRCSRCVLMRWWCRPTEIRGGGPQLPQAHPDLPPRRWCAPWTRAGRCKRIWTG